VAVKRKRKRPPLRRGESWAVRNVQSVLRKWREEHGYEPGMVWDARVWDADTKQGGAYVWPDGVRR
jgi:hypothetical protein